MFRSKKQPAEPKAPWAIQILTTEYLIDGRIPPAVYDSGGVDLFALIAMEGDHDDSGIATLQFVSLAGARLQPTGNLATPAESFAEWTLVACANLVAIIPNDDASQAAVRKAFEMCEHTIDAVIYAGPYRIRGVIQSQNADQLELPVMSTWSGLPVCNATVDSQVPGASFAGLRVPWLVVNAITIHGVGRS